MTWISPRSARGNTQRIRGVSLSGSNPGHTRYTRRLPGRMRHQGRLGMAGPDVMIVPDDASQARRAERATQEFRRLDSNQDKPRTKAWWAANYPTPDRAAPKIGSGDASTIPSPLRTLPVLQLG